MAITPSHSLESKLRRKIMEIKEKEEMLQQQYLTFFLADEEYAINIQRVKEIIEYTTVTKVPKVPEWIRGVINLRGNVVPVVDLTVRFGLEAGPVTKTTCIVIVEVEQDSERTVIGVISYAVFCLKKKKKQSLRAAEPLLAEMTEGVGARSSRARGRVVLGA